MAEIKKTSNQTLIDYMSRDYDSLLKSMQDLVPEKLPEWKDYQSQADFGNVMLQLFAHMGDILSYYQDRIANESFLGTAQTRRSIIHHLRLIGYKLSTAAPASTALTLIVPATFNDVVTIRKGDAFATKSQKNKPSVRFEYTSETDLTINCDRDDIPIVEGKKHIKEIIPVEEGRLIKDEILGRSDGKPNQRYVLAHPGLIMRSLGSGQEINKDIILLSELGDVINEWKLQESLAFSREEQKDFVIEINEQDRATVIFGDGAFGAIPLNGATVKTTYRVGGGIHGNVAKESIDTIVDAPQLSLLGANIFNESQASGGADRESIDHAVQHAPEVFRSLKRAVTADDYKALALDFKGVGKVRAVGTNWNIVTLFVAPEGGGQVSDLLKANLLAYFEDKRPLSTIIQIADVDYVKIFVTADVELESYYSKVDIKEKVKKAAGGLLDFNKVDFAKTIYLSKFYEKIEAIDGVRSVNISEFGKIKDADEDDGRIELAENEIPRMPDITEDNINGADYSGGINVKIDGGI